MDVVASKSGVSAIVEYDYSAKEPDELDLVKGAIIHSIKQMPGGWWEGTLQSSGRTGMFPDNFVRVVDTNDDNTVLLRDKSAISNRRCKVIYSYTQVNDDELSLAVGDVIEFLGEVEEGWWRGRLRNKVGVFPSNFVIAIEPSPILASKRPPSTVGAIGVAATKAAAVAGSTSSGSGSAAAAAAMKKTNRLSLHNSKEDLLSSTTTTPSSTAATSSSTSALGTSIAGVGAKDDGAPSLPPKPQREYCRVEYPYVPQNDDELELKVGDIITIHSMELPDKGWWKGEIRGKVGVFPDNFVKLLSSSEVSPLNDLQHHHQQQHLQQQQQSHRTAKTSNIANALNSAPAGPISSNASTTIPNITAAASATSAPSATSVSATAKSLIKKSGSTSSTQSSNRKDSFGSRDSLNDILSETGLSSGNVAAQRKSLENKNLDLSNAPDAGARMPLRKQPLHHAPHEPRAATNSMSGATSTPLGASSELRKSMENMEEKLKTTPPPVLTKKPTVPSKKSTTVTSVAGNLLSGLKQKVKNVENKLTTAASHDFADGVCSSKMSPGGVVADASGSGGNVVMRRAATIAVEDAEFDRVERSSILSDMRAGRVKAPKRRPPSTAMNVIGENNNNNNSNTNNNSIYLNGSGSGSGSEAMHSDDQGKVQSSDDNSIGEEQLAKPKPREWEKKKAPWMEELKASQVKKKTSPNVESHTNTATGSSGERSSKLFSDDMKITNTSNSGGVSSSNSYSSTATASTIVTSSSNSFSKVQSSSVSSSNMLQQSVAVESSSNGSASNRMHADAMTKSLSAKFAHEAASTMAAVTAAAAAAAAATTTTANVSTTDDGRARPNSLSIRNRSLSPSVVNARNAPMSAAGSSSPTDPPSSTSHNSNNSAPSSTSSNNTCIATAKPSATSLLNNYQHQQEQQHQHQHQQQHQPHYHHHHENNISATNTNKSTTSASASESVRVVELERRVDKLESLVYAQQRTIDELVRSLREETDRVKLLRGELDKYAQCVTQV